MSPAPARYQFRPRHPRGVGLRQPWRSVNGPIRLMQLLGRMPDLLPYTFSVQGTLQTNAASTAVFTATMDADADFYAMSASVALAGTGEEGIQAGGGGVGLHPFNWWATVEIQEGSSGIRLSNDPVSVGGVFGAGDQPFYYPVPWIVRAGAEIKVTVRNFSTVAGAASQRAIFCWHGFKKFLSSPELPIDVLLEPRLLETLQHYREQGKLGHVEPFFYSLLTGQTALSGGAGSFVPLQMETPTITIAEADFAACYLMAEFYDSTGKVAEYGTRVSGATTVDDYTHLVQLVIDEGDTRLSDRPVPVSNLFGHGKRVMPLPKPLVLKAGQTFTIILAPQTAAPPADGIWKGQFTLAGVRIFPSKVRR